MGDGYSLRLGSNSFNNNSSNGYVAKTTTKTKKKKKSSGKKKKMSVEQTFAAKSVCEWVFLDSPSAPTTSVDGFGIPKNHMRFADNVKFELHSHSTCSDGFLSPYALVERAHRNGMMLVGLINSSSWPTRQFWCFEETESELRAAAGFLLLAQVKVLALTDHDTMAGIPEALEAARKFSIKIIPGVEISTIFSTRGESGTEEPVHILAYYSSCGPSRFEELEKCLAIIRDGRFVRAKNMVSKLNNLKVPLKWEHVAKIAGNGVAPGRLHVARAMVEAGHVENLKQAFNRYLYDGGPAYSTGSESLAEEAVQLICQTGGVAALAHPWALKNPVAVIRKLKAAGLHGMEVYRSDGKLAAFSELADTYDLLKLGGSDYHGRRSQYESDLGSVNLPVSALHKFLQVARPIWCNAIKDVLQNFAEEPSDSNLQRIARFGRIRNLKGGSLSCGKDVIDLCLSSWLTVEERQTIDVDALSLKLSCTVINQTGIEVSAASM